MAKTLHMTQIFLLYLYIIYVFQYLFHIYQGLVN